MQRIHARFSIMGNIAPEKIIAIFLPAERDYVVSGVIYSVLVLIRMVFACGSKKY